MAITGLLLFGFLISHLAGNLLLFAKDPTIYNTYSHKLISNPLIYAAAAGLLLIFVYHVVSGFIVTFQNRAARPVAYAETRSLGKKTFASATMIWSGVIIFFFLIIHLKTFKFGADVAAPIPLPDGTEMRDLRALVIASFQNKIYSIFYVLCMATLGLHLSHAMLSSCRTLGISHPKYLSWIKIISVFTAVFFAIGFSIFPVWFGFLRNFCNGT